jgi:uncharacterized membrane protein
MELKDVTGRFARILTWGPVLVLIGLSIYTLNLMKDWQNSVRLLMEMAPIESAYPFTVLWTAAVTALVVILLTYLFLYAATWLVNTVGRYLPRRISIVLGSTVFVLFLMSFVDGVIIKNCMSWMNLLRL